MNKIKQITLPQIVRVRKYEVDNKKLVELLRYHKKMTNKQIAEIIGCPITNVEHWFRQDKYFSVPDAEIWFDLKNILGITTDEFDKQIITFEERIGTFEKAERCYLMNGICPTLECLCGNYKVLIWKQSE